MSIIVDGGIADPIPATATVTMRMSHICLMFISDPDYSLSKELKRVSQRVDLRGVTTLTFEHLRE